MKKGHKAVIFNKLIGVKKDVYDEGFHFKIPLIEHVIEFDVRNKPYANKLTLNSKGICIRTIFLQNIHLNFFLFKIIIKSI